MGVRAIDVSRHQGTIDWRAVKASGVQGAWIKVGGADGGTYRDSRAGSNLTAADEAGIAYGTYYFAVPSSGSAVAQAQHAVGCGHGRGQLWPAVDVELNPTDLTREQLDRWTAEFCAEVKRLTGRESVVYCNASGGMDGRTFVGWTDAAARCPLWIANYGPNRPGTTPPAFSPALPTVWSAWAVWQFNDQTPVAGIQSATVDQNVVADAFWAQMTAPSTEEDDDMPPVKLIFWTRPDSQWAADVAQLPDDPDHGRAAAFLINDFAGTCKHIASPEQLNHLHDLHVEDRGFADDWVFEGYTLVGPGGPA
jgi:GH25 family lysozyme M1 (1,4-beta-N-acetylmuramidase)